MRVIITQQGSGSRILAAQLGGFDPGEVFAREPAPSQAEAKQYLALGVNFRLMYNHLEDQPWLYDLLRDAQVVHLYRDPGRTFTRKMAKYKDQGPWSWEDLRDHIEFVKDMRRKVNAHFKDVVITHYEDFIKDLYHGEVKEFSHL